MERLEDDDDDVVTPPEDGAHSPPVRAPPARGLPAQPARARSGLICYRLRAHRRAQRRLEFRTEARETRSTTRRKIEINRPAAGARPSRALPLGAGKRKRAAGSALSGDASANNKHLTMDEQSTRLPCHYLQAHMFIKRRMYIESQDPRVLWQAKALEGELRRRMHSAMSALAESAYT